MCAMRRYLRVATDPLGTAEALQTSCVRFASSDGQQTVDLIGAVHIADADYYKNLNEKFKEYDAVLFELVADDERLKSLGQNQGHSILSLVQKLMSRSLALVHQVDHIDYSAGNMVHADLSFAQLKTALRARGGSLAGIVIEVLRHVLVNAGRGKSVVPGLSPFELLQAAFVPGGASRKLKVYVAKVFGDQLDDVTLGSTTLQKLVIEDRNKAALEVLKRELGSGKKKIAIFYGAAHNPDFENRLLLDFGLEVREEVWLDAWKLS
jgi:hypothetical protein